MLLKRCVLAMLTNCVAGNLIFLSPMNFDSVTCVSRVFSLLLSPLSSTSCLMAHSKSDVFFGIPHFSFRSLRRNTTLRGCTGMESPSPQGPSPPSGLYPWPSSPLGACSLLSAWALSPSGSAGRGQLNLVRLSED